GSLARDDATASTGADADAGALAGTATNDTLGPARGMAAIDAADDHRAASIEASRDAALRVASDVGLRSEHAETLRSFDSPAATAAHERAIDAMTASLGLGAPSPGADPTTALNSSPALP